MSRIQSCQVPLVFSFQNMQLTCMHKHLHTCRRILQTTPPKPKRKKAPPFYMHTYTYSLQLGYQISFIDNQISDYTNIMFLIFSSLRLQLKITKAHRIRANLIGNYRKSDLKIFSHKFKNQH